jgi:hypothetical protein
LVNERARPALRAIEGGNHSKAVPLSTFLPWRKRAVRAQRHAAWLAILNRRLLLLPDGWRSRANFSDYESALAVALDAPDYDFALFVARFTGMISVCGLRCIV